MRMIKVKSCAGCPYKNYFEGVNITSTTCDNLLHYVDVAKHEANSTIHPDCPLEVCDE